jgi:hypothetical protein
MNVSHPVRSWSIISLACVLAACDNRNDIVTPLTEAPPGVLQAEAAVTVAGVPIHLTAEAFRNLMPGSTDSRMFVVLHLATAAGSTFPTGVAATSAWVIFGNDAWTVVPTQEASSTVPGRLDLMLRGGPTWPVGNEVKVVVRLRDASGNEQLLRADPAPKIQGAF